MKKTEVKYMKEKNEITGYAEVENGMIHIPKVYMRRSEAEIQIRTGRRI